MQKPSHATPQETVVLNCTLATQLHFSSRIFNRNTSVNISKHMWPICHKRVTTQNL